MRDSFGDLNPHARGLQEMIRLRGGIRNIHSKGGFLAQFVMLVNYHLAIILERDLFICPPSGHDYRYVNDYVPVQPGLDSPFYRARREPCRGWNTWGPVDDQTAGILEDMYFLTTTLHDYLCGRPYEGTCTSWFVKANRIQRRINALPSVPMETIDKATPHQTVIYELVRLTAVIYCHSILTYTPLSTAPAAAAAAAAARLRSSSPSSSSSSSSSSSTSPSSSPAPDYVQQIHTLMSLLPCTLLARIPGTWLWTLVVINPSARYRVEGLRFRMFLKNCTSALGLMDWQFVVNCCEASVGIQRWVRRRGIPDGVMGKCPGKEWEGEGGGWPDCRDRGEEEGEDVVQGPGFGVGEEVGSLEVSSR